jgi:hypothetical protein
MYVSPEDSSRFFAVFGGMPGEVVGAAIAFANPEGIEAFSPGL